MKQRKWRGTALFVGILAVMGLTVGLKLYESGMQPVAAALSTPSPQSDVTATPSPSSSSSPSSSPSPSAVPGSPSTASITGSVVQTPYGPVQVAVTFTNKKITAVKELQAPSDRDLSVQINAYAEPILAQEVLQSQSANIDTVSGATYTSEGYAQSVQSAIDRL